MLLLHVQMCALNSIFHYPKINSILELVLKLFYYNTNYIKLLYNINGFKYNYLQITSA